MLRQCKFRQWDSLLHTTSFEILKDTVVLHQHEIIIQQKVLLHDRKRRTACVVVCPRDTPCPVRWVFPVLSEGLPLVLFGELYPYPVVGYPCWGRVTSCPVRRSTLVLFCWYPLDRTSDRTRVCLLPPGQTRHRTWDLTSDGTRRYPSVDRQTDTRENTTPVILRTRAAINLKLIEMHFPYLKHSCIAQQ